MTTHDPRQEPLDPIERELARVVRALPGGEPPAALDAMILKASQDAVAARPLRRVNRWLAGGAIWGIGSAAAAVLAIGVGWQVLNPATTTQLPMPAQRQAPSAATGPAAEDSAGTVVEFREAPAKVYDNAPPPPPAVTSAPAEPVRARAVQPAPVAPAAAPPPPVEDAPAMTVSGTGQINPIDVASVESTTVLTAEQLAKLKRADAREAEASQRASASNEVRAKAAGALAADSAAAAAAPRVQGYARQAAKHEADVSGRPATWLKRIREQRDRGDDEAARETLRKFRQRYPDYPIPSDLTRLLDQ